MNVIENILTLEHYKKINALREIRKALGELQYVSIDFSQENWLFEYKDLINKTISDLIKDIPYEFPSIKITGDNFRDLFVRDVTTMPNIYVSSGHHRHGSWRFDENISSRSDRTSVTTYAPTSGPAPSITLQNQASFDRFFNDSSVQDRTVTLSDINSEVRSALDSNIIATFNGREIGDLESITYTTSDDK